MRRTLLALAVAAPLFSQQTTLPGDAAVQLLSHPANPQAQFLNKNPGWQPGAVQNGTLYFTDPKTNRGAVILGSVTHQDGATGAWAVNDAALSSTANGWRLDGGAYSVFVRQAASAVSAAQHTISQTYTDYATQHASTLSLTVPKLTYSNGLAFGFALDGLNWTLQFTGGGFFQIRSVVAKRQGKGAHSFPLTSSETLTVNSQGQIVGSSQIGLTRAMMIPKFGKPVDCSAWSYAKGIASFTCDDTALSDSQFPYVIDPQSEITLTNSGTYQIYDWNDGQGNSGYGDARVNFSLTGLPSTIVIDSVSCAYNVLDSQITDGDNLQCAVSSTPPYASTAMSCAGYYLCGQYGTSNTTNTTATVWVNFNLGSGDSSWSDGAGVNDIQFLAYYANFTPPPGTYPMPLSVTLSSNSLYGGQLAVNGSGTSSGLTATLTGTSTVVATAISPYYGCNYNGCGSTPAPIGFAQVSYTAEPTVATPGISPGAGTYTTAQNVTLSCATQGATIRYTLDGSTPSETNGTIYTGGFTLNSNNNPQGAIYPVKAIAYESGWVDSAVAAATITITGTVGAPTFSLPGGIYQATQSLTLSSATPGATIRYTTNGTTPSETNGTVYSGPIAVATNETVNAIAYESGWADSAVSAETYYFQNAGGSGGTTGPGGGPQAPTPPADSGNGLDPRRVGIRALGSYWGDAGENIDTISNNLNFATPLIKPQGRGGWTLPFQMSYNSQMWRHDSAGDWLLGEDVGYGMGWKLQVGSLTPIWNSSAQIDHYLFTDATGAEYSLSVNTGGVWTSLEGIYISYDSNANRLYSTDGSFWVMGSTSSASEQDAGSMYPTLAEDSNGNQININYQAGLGTTAANTSARISTVVDTRGTYTFNYTLLSPNDNFQHLASITGMLGEQWVLTYTNSSFSSPISNASFGTTELLASLQPAYQGVYQPPAATFSYGGGAELTQYVTSLGGTLGWNYRTFTYSGNVSLREVTSRTVNQGAGGFTNSHGLGHDDSGDANRTYHYYTYFSDYGAGTTKIYYNEPAYSGSSLIAPWVYQEYQYYATIQKDFGFSQNPAGNTYMSAIWNVLWAPNNSAYNYSFTGQTLDNYGNLTVQQVYDYGAGAPTRTYNLTYLTDPNYTSRYIRNRLTSATVTDAHNNTIGLASLAYDNPTIGQNQVPQNNQGQQVYTTQHDSAYGTSFTYRGNVTSSWKMGTTAKYAYDTGGNPYLAQDGDGMTISISTDSSTNGSLPSTLTPNGNTNLLTSLTYSSVYTLTSATGANGANQQQGNDAYGRPAYAKSVDGGTTSYVYTYGPNTQTASTTVSNPTLTCTQSNNCNYTSSGTSTNSNSLWKKTTYDGFGRVIQVQTGHDATVINTVDTVYGACACSPLGKVMKVSLPYGPGETEVWTVYTYDASGRQLTSTAPDGSVTTTAYSENTVTTTDPAGIWKTNTTDAFGNLTSVQEPDPANLSANGPLTTYVYNAANQLTGVSMTRGAVTQNRSFSYSGSDLITETTPEAGTVTYSYDLNHHVTQRTDAKGQQTQYTYDAYERLTEVRHYTPTGTNNSLVEDPTQRVDYYYDTPVANDWEQDYTWGHLSGVLFHQPVVSGANLAYEYSYNQAGHVTGNRMLITNVGTTVDEKAQYAYDDHGRMTSMTYPSGPVMNYEFDPMGRTDGMTETSNGQNTVAAAATFGSNSQLLTMFYGTNAHPFNESRTYNSLLQLTHLVNASLDMQYIYNTGHNNGRVAQTIDGILGETVNYTYDNLHRLTSAVATNNSWGESYTFDGFGNLTGKTPTVGSAPAYSGGNSANNAPSSVDANGDVQSMPGGGGSPIAATAWDVENRLASSRPAGTADTLSYVYDPWGRRVWKSDVNTTNSTNTVELYFRGSNGKVLETYTVTGATNINLPTPLNLVGINTYFAGQMLSEKGVYVAADRLGSVRADSNGVAMSYFPWGEERTSTADGRTKFAGYYRDGVGMDYANARYYSATTGSFWSPDPASIQSASPSAPSSWNRYSYVTGDPINAIDPRGTDLFFLGYPGAQDCNADPSQPGCNDPCQPNPYMDGMLDAPMPACTDDPEGGGDGDQATQSASTPDCGQVLQADVKGFLDSYDGGISPLDTSDNIQALLTAGMSYNVDPRFIVALSVAESQAGTHLGWGPFNAWNIRSRNPGYKGKGKKDPYTSWQQSINAINDLISGSQYFGAGLTTTSTIYQLFEGPNYQVGLKNLNTALGQMHGDQNTLTDPCNPANLRPPNQ